MATVGSHKGNRGRPCGLILLLAFGVALLGVMALHRVRERHIFNHVIQEKDKELSSLQLLLQRERDQNKELKRKSEEVKGRLYSLGAKKMELDNRILEMQSRVESIKEEQKTMESALDEKQNEFKWLKERFTNSVKESSNLTALMERLKQKESEIEDLKHQLESSGKVWSVSTDDPSKKLTGSARNGENLTRAEQGSKNNSTNVREGLNALAVAAAENREATTNRKEMAGEQTYNLLTSKNNDSIDGVTTSQGNNNETQHKKLENFQYGESAVKNEEKNVADATEANVDNGHNSGKSRSAEGHEQTMDGEDIKKTEDGHQEKLGHKENGEPRRLLKDTMSREIPDNFRSADFSMRGRHGLLSRMIAGDRSLLVHENSETSGVKSTSSRYSSHGPNESKRAEETTASAQLKMDNEGELPGQSIPMEIVWKKPSRHMNFEVLKAINGTSNFADHEKGEVGQLENQEVKEIEEFSTERKRIKDELNDDDDRQSAKF